jgi:hypothetical protein
MLLIPIVHIEQMKTLPATPFIMRGCEGECCGNIKSNKIINEAKLFQYPDVTSKVVGSLKKNSTFDLNKFEMYIRVGSYGSAEYSSKKLTVISAESEGAVFAFDGTKFDSFGGGSDECIACERSSYKYKAPVTESWIKIYYGKNNWGWIKNVNNIEPGTCS